MTYFSEMNEVLPKLNTICLLIIAVSLSVIAYRQLQSNYVVTEKGIIDTHSGEFFQKQGNQLIPVYESTEEKLRREYPGGTNYK
jgi:hypothetical protein